MRTLVAAMVGILVLTSGGPFSFGQGSQPKEKEEVIETRGDKGSPEPAPAVPKNSPNDSVQTRSGRFTCDVVVNNTTPFYIHRVWIDNAFWGSVSRRARGTAEDISVGRTKLYAEADFTDGSVHRWGPTYVECNSYSTFRWNLQ